MPANARHNATAPNNATRTARNRGAAKCSPTKTSIVVALTETSGERSWAFSRMVSARRPGSPEVRTTMLGDVVAVEQNLSQGRLAQAGQQGDGRRFAGPIGPEQSQDVARRQREAHVANRRDRSVVLRQVSRFKPGLDRRAFSSKR